MFGVTLKPKHYGEIAAAPRRVDWFEAISENYMASYGRALDRLLAVRRDHPVGLHGVSMSLGSIEGVAADYLRDLAELIATLEPAVVSDHLCFSSAGGHYSHDLLPMPLTMDAARLTAANIQRVQERLGRQILVENVSAYVRTPLDSMAEADFVAEVVARADCGLLLDVNNVIVNAHNFGFDADAYVDRLPLARVGEIHLAGHSVRDDYLFDDHVGPTPERVWALYARTLAGTGPVRTLVEWDTDVPDFETLARETDRARALAAGAV